MDEVFHALADSRRRDLIGWLIVRNGRTLSELRDGVGVTRQAVETGHVLPCADKQPEGF